jgi:biotin carboxyl carrier protein
MLKKLQKYFGRSKTIQIKNLRRDVAKNKQYKRVRMFAEHRPFTTFLIGLAILFGVIALGQLLNTLNRKEEAKKESIKSVQVYDLNGTPSVTVQAKVDKSGVIQILAQSAGVVQSVTAKEGTAAFKGQTLVTLSSNYQGGNAPALQYQLANTQYKNVSDTFSTQKDIITKQRDIAEKTEANAEELRKIASDSASDTHSLLDLNQDILDTINTNLTNLENSNVNGANDQLIFQTKQQKSQVQSGIVQLQAQVRQLDYQRSGDKSAAQLGQLQKEITLKQLEVQEKALTLSLEVGRIQRDLAGVAASLMTPATPCAGTIERIYVKPGDTVSPGMPIALIKTGNTEVTLEALVPADIASAVSRSTPSTITIPGSEKNIIPYYVSREATSGSLYSVLYNLTDTVTDAISDGSFITVKMPIGYQMQDVVPYIPLDAVYQTQSESYVFIVNGNRSVSKKVKLGDVYGRFVTVTQGLSGSERVILNRNIVSGEQIKVSP